MQEVSLTEILDAREKRAFIQKELIQKYKTPLICFTMNIAGPVKVTPLIERAFYTGVKLLKEKIKSVKYESIKVMHTGCVGMFAVDDSPEILKELCVEIEENFPLGRLFDIDIISTDFKKFERKTQRGCIVCKKPGRECSAGRLHSVKELQHATSKILINYFENEISELAKESLIYEVNVTPKPGLVDKRNNGSHKDMNINTFLRSAESISPYFGKCFSIGYKNNCCFDLLKDLGIQAEKNMFKATGGVNTHKGIIYSMGFICAAFGSLLKENAFPTASDICKAAGNLAKNNASEAFENITLETAGGRIYKKHGIKGIRGEVSGGFKSITEISLPYFKKLLNKDVSLNDAGVLTLLKLISKVDDTCIYNRGGIDSMRYAKEKALQAICDNNPEALDDDFISKNLSPGGCADLLAITYFLNIISNDI